MPILQNYGKRSLQLYFPSYNNYMPILQNYGKRSLQLYFPSYNNYMSILQYSCLTAYGFKHKI